MKKVIPGILLTVLVLFFTNSITAQKADFNGAWKLDRSKMTAPGNFPVLTQITINIKGDSLLTERFYDTGQGQEYPFDENLTLDGKENLITIYEMPRKSKASWTEKDVIITLESIITVNGSNGPADFKSIETWTIDNVNNILTISFKNSLSSEESTGAFVFNKSDKSN